MPGLTRRRPLTTVGACRGSSRGSADDGPGTRPAADRGTRHARELLVHEVDHVAADPVVVEEIAGDEKEIGPVFKNGIDHESECVAHVLAVVPIVQVDVGGVRDPEGSIHASIVAALLAEPWSIIRNADSSSRRGSVALPRRRHAT